MKRSKSLVCLGTALVVASGTLSTAALAEEATIPTELTEWISDDGGSAGRELPAISADGRYVVLVGRSSAYAGVWIKDRAQPEKKAWRIATGFLFNPDISADGKVVAWSLYGGGEGGQAVYVLEWQKPGATPEMVSLSDSGNPAAGTTDYPSLSGDGRYVAFQSMDKTLDADAKAGPAGGGPNKVYVRDRLTGDTQMVSVADTDAGDVIVNGNAVRPDITPDGRYVAFGSDAGILQGAVEEGHEVVAAAPPDDHDDEEESFQQVYVRDRVAGMTSPVSLATDGTTFGDGGSSTEYGPTISDDGMKIAFESDASNLVAGDTNGDTDAFVRNMATGTTFMVSLDEDGKPVDLVNPEPEVAALAGPGGGGGGGGGGEGESGPDLTPNIGAGPAISGDGNFVAFESIAALTADDINGVGESSCTDAEGTYTAEVPISDVYLVEIGDDAVVADGLARQSIPNDVEGAFEAWGFRIDGMTGLCAPSFNGADPAIARDGSRVAFVSAGNLVGRTVEEEDHGGEATTDGLGIEPSTYLHRPNPEPDIAAPVSKAKGPQYASTRTFVVKYAAADSVFPWTGVDRVQLWLKRPGETTFVKRQVDIGDAMDNEFTVGSLGVSGKFAYYTVALDNAGNWEPAPTKADAVTIVDLVAPVIKNARVVPNPFDISDDRFTEFKMRTSEKANTTFLVKRNGVVVKRFATKLSPRGLVTQAWYGRNDAGRFVLNGDYVVVMRVKDPAGNLTVARVRLPVTR
jgi:hypothetical protein